MEESHLESYVILDALDECSNRAELMEIIETMARWQLENVHILVTSRKEQDIPSSLQSFTFSGDAICPRSNLVDRDIHTYIHQRFPGDQDMRQEIEAVLMKKAHGRLISRSPLAMN